MHGGRIHSLYRGAKKPVVTIAPISIALTTKRVIIFRPKSLGLGLSFEDYVWRNVGNIHISEAILGSTFSLDLVDGRKTFVDSLPKAQARKIYQFGQQMEEQMHAHRRELMLEEKRAAAGGVNVAIGSPPATPQAAAEPLHALPVAAPEATEDPLEKLQKLKKMLEAELISQPEYDAKKAEIMSRF